VNTVKVVAVTIGVVLALSAVVVGLACVRIAALTDRQDAMSPERQWQEDDDAESFDNACTWCGGEGYDECDDPIQCCTPGCDGEWCMCKACDGRGYDQVVW
jgi:hypothetical protein